MIYLVFSIVVIRDVAAGVQVAASTGDMGLTVPLLTVPGVKGEDYPIILSYSGAGIKMERSSGWVGLGFSLDSGAVSRSMLEFPDDVKDGKIFLKHLAQTEDTRGWWQRFVEDYLVAVILLIITIILVIAQQYWALALWSIVSEAVSMAYYQGGVDLATLARHMYQKGILTLATMGVSELANLKSLSFLKDIMNTAGQLMAFGGCAGMAISAVSMAASYVQGQGKSFPGSGNYEEIRTMDGFLHDPTFQEEYADDNYIAHDGGAPDTWTLSGPVSGSLVLAQKDTLARFSGITDAKFFLASTPEVPATDVEHIMSSDGKSIESFVVTDSSGQRYVFGDPSISGSIIKQWTSGSYAKYDEDLGDEFYKLDDINLNVASHTMSWKLVAMLSSDYVDGNGDLNPYDASESSNKGSWVAFRYDLTHWYAQDSPNCGFNFGNSYDGSWQWMSEHDGSDDGWRMKSGGVMDKSYLQAIITPTHKAEFTIEERYDGREHYSAWSTNMVVVICLGGGSDCDGSIPCCGTSSCYDDLEAGWMCDGTESSQSKTIYRGPHSFNPVTEQFCESTTCGEHYCNSDVGSVDYPYRLTTITLYARDSSLVPMGVVKFNGGTSTSNMYYLKPGTPGNEVTNNPDGGVYTLKNVKVCDANGANCKRTSFEY